MTIHNPTPFINPVASYLQQSTNLIAQPSIPDPVREPIKKLTSLMEELVVSLRSDSRGNQQRNRNNAPFCGNCAQITCFACRQLGHIASECPIVVNNNIYNQQPFGTEGQRIINNDENTNRNRPTVDIARAQTMLAQLLNNEGSLN
ncbi:hypothetical protein C2G38_2049641 [Gigaspora rosea]|uniref:CCHC-type domain-containing protein n=1 Tax=Gigaspora rosea TaxID=44941 RepID=A0A397TYA1_9GLOM|nr:hypothetical protein C2G38_2049641 [Gigaspora rosea]